MLGYSDLWGVEGDLWFLGLGLSCTWVAPEEGCLMGCV